MSTLRVAIAGVDGTGKTTIIRRLNELHQDNPNDVFAIRAPQYHEIRTLPLGPISEIIDHLSVYADQTGNVQLKCTALFLSMTLFGDIERHVISTYQPKVLFTERQCFLDCLAYSQFYLPLLAKAESLPMARPAASDPGLSVEQLQLLRSWVSVLRRREPMLEFQLDSLTVNGTELFRGSHVEIFMRLKRLFNADIPDQIIILSTSMESIASRLLLKKGETRIAELHERAEVLLQLTKTMRQVCLFLKSIKPGLLIQEINSEMLSVDETVSAVMRSLPLRAAWVEAC